MSDYDFHVMSQKDYNDYVQKVREQRDRITYLEGALQSNRDTVAELRLDKKCMDEDIQRLKLEVRDLKEGINQRRLANDHLYSRLKDARDECQSMAGEVDHLVDLLSWAYDQLHALAFANWQDNVNLHTIKQELEKQRG